MEGRLYRASELGGCTKAIVAKHLGYDPAEYPANFNTLFAEGNLHEEAVIATLMDENYEILDRQLELELKINDDCYIQGHIDGLVIAPMTNRKKVLEVKSMGQAAWDKFKAYRWDDEGLIQKYKWQLSAYMLALDLEALVVFKNRNTGELRFEGVEVPFFNLDQIKSRVLECESWIEREELPSDCSVNQYPCPFYYLHDQGGGDVDGEEISAEDKEAAERAARAYLDSKAAYDGAKSDYNANRAALLSALNAVSDSITIPAIGKLTAYSYSQTTYDHKRMSADGIDLSKYAKKTTSKRVRVTLDRNGDSQDGTEVS